MKIVFLKIFFIIILYFCHLAKNIVVWNADFLFYNSKDRIEEDNILKHNFYNFASPMKLFSQLHVMEDKPWLMSLMSHFLLFLRG